MDSFSRVLVCMIWFWFVLGPELTRACSPPDSQGRDGAGQAATAAGCGSIMASAVLIFSASCSIQYSFDASASR